jgi:hypothetical protein
MRERSKIVIAIAPNNAATNTFVNAFGRAIVGYSYGSQLPKGTDVLIMHWPDIFFSEQTEKRTAELNQLLNEWIAAKENRGLHLVWVCPFFTAAFHSPMLLCTECVPFGRRQAPIAGRILMVLAPLLWLLRIGPGGGFIPTPNL